VNILPLGDATFIAELYQHNLLPGNLKDLLLISKQITQKNKATYFWIMHAIKPSVTSGVGISFSDLTVMENSEYENVKTLSKQITSSLKEGTTNNGGG